MVYAAGTPLADILVQLDVDPKAAARMADRRSMRCALLYEGWTEAELNAMSDQIQPNRMRLDPATKFFLPTFAAMFLDGLVAVREAENVLLGAPRTRPPRTQGAEVGT